MTLSKSKFVGRNCRRWFLPKLDTKCWSISTDQAASPVKKIDDASGHSEEGFRPETIQIEIVDNGRCFLTKEMSKTGEHLSRVEGKWCRGVIVEPTLSLPKHAPRDRL